MDNLSEKLNLTLNSHANILLDGIWNLYKSEIGADLVFVCCGGKKLKVHRWLIQIFAPHILEHSHTDSIQLIIEKDTLDLIFQFLYRGELDVNDSELSRLKEAAKMLVLDHLLEAINNVKSPGTDVENGITSESDSDSDWEAEMVDFTQVTKSEQVLTDKVSPAIVRLSNIGQPTQTDMEIVNNVGNDILVISKPFVQQRSILKKSCDLPNESATKHKLQKSGDTPVITWKKNASGGVTVRCIKCEFVATEKGVYQKHVTVNHPELDVVERLQCRCPTCDFVVSQKDLMYYHWRDTHKPKKPKTFQCTHCDFVAETKRLFDRHQRNKHSTDRPFACHLCDYRGTTKVNLKVHMDIHNTKLYKCETCGKIGNSQTNMRKHRLIHLNQQFPCPVCSYPFRNKITLRRHLLIKHNMRLSPGKMERIDRQQTHYKLVQKIQCPVCDCNVSQNRDLQNHLAACHQLDEHLNPINPTIPCPDCEYLCFVETELIVHYQQVHGRTTDKAVCDICWNTYSSKYIKLHRETVHITDAAKHMCHLCGFTTNSRAGLCQHMRRCSGKSS
ncbi:hypothetical protein CHUAL_005453 [Chamberlinius hualienensis]